MAMHPAYRTVVAAGRSGNTLLLDIGCCSASLCIFSPLEIFNNRRWCPLPVGTDARKAAHDGYPAANIVGSDLHAEYLRLGYKLYDDESDCNISFFAADVFDLDSDGKVDSPGSTSEPEARTQAFSNLRELNGKVTHIYAGLLFQLFDESTQTRLARCLAALLYRNPGAIIFGRHEGREEAGLISAEDERCGTEYETPYAYQLFCRPRFGHSPESWEKLWRDVFTSLESEEFVKDKLRFRSKLHASNTPMPDFPNSKWLFWALKII